MKQKKIRRNAAGPVITGAVAWVLSFLLVLLTVLGVVACTVCNSRYLRSQVLESGFCQATLEQLNENYISYGNAGGIPQEVMTSIVTEDQIQQDMFRAVEALYQGDRRLIAHPEVAEAAVEAIENNLEERGIQLTDEIREAVQEMASGCQVDYDNYVQLIVAPYIAPYMARITQMVWIGFAVLAVVCVIALVLLMRLQPSGAARLRWCINAFSAAVLFSVVVPLLFNGLIRMDRLNLKPETLKMLVASYTHGAVEVFFYFALIYAVVVIALAIAWRAGLKQYRMVYRREKEEREEV
ncbi:hypothetical protein [Allofournierella massiliensis]|uniref:Uncharacterized protein n=1 Tax=Allofournierella massiliensis TaxID=1650663 RepID=A0A4R1R409_9FIRM|nr:hypothetical protein [Fournierella massiliensis]TCL60159.1 hypothetical protein EDD77_10435 [Fournierella massiliensis]